MPTISELLLPEYDDEIKTTRTVLERVPDEDGKGEWKPHPKAFPLAHLAQLVAGIPAWTTMTIQQDELDIAPKDKPTMGYSIQKTSALLEQFDKGAKAGREAIANVSDDKFHEPWTLLAGGEKQYTKPRYMIFRQMVLNHLVHHRAQLGLYLRLLDLAVPEMYGPTADTKKAKPA